MDIKSNYLDSLLETGIKKDWIPIINDEFEYSNLYESFIKDEITIKWQEFYKGYNISYEIKGEGILTAVHIEIIKK